MLRRILVLNMGSTSTKIAVYSEKEKIWSESISHPRGELALYEEYMGQYAYRKKIILSVLKDKGEIIDNFTAIVSRGGTIKPVSGGVYIINQTMLDDAWSGYYGEHPCNIGGQIAFDLSKEYNIPALTVDPPVCNEMCTEAKYSGLPEIERKAVFQALNQRAIARRYCSDLGVDYKEVDLIVAHMGGGVSVAAHKKGKIVDVNNALAGDGPFALERSGGLPVGDLINICYSGRYEREEVLRLVNGKGGMAAYLKTTDAREIESRISQGDSYALEVTKAMTYQIAKEINGISAVFNGEVDAILLTGGLAYWDRFVDFIKERVSFIAPIYRYPGENEMESLVFGALRYLNGEEKAQDYA